jgi:hypothetical protein
LEYFERAGWLPDWIATAKGIVTDEYERSYAHAELTGDHSNAPESGLRPAPSKKSQNIFDNLPLLAKPSLPVKDELTQYLSTGTLQTDSPLLWWHQNSHVYPRLSRMALDYLSIPSTTVDVERTFSQGRLVLSHVRSRLSIQSTRALMCLGSWSRAGFAPPKKMAMVLSPMADVPDDEDEWLDYGWDSLALT